MDQEQHDKNLVKFRKASEKNNLAYNEDKCIFSTTNLKTLGFVIENVEISPDSNLLRPVKKLPLPYGGKSLKRALGLFSHYTQCIPKFSDKITPFVKSKSFPLSTDAKNAFELVKSKIEKSVVVAIQEFQ